MLIPRMWFDEAIYEKTPENRPNLNLQGSADVSIVEARAIYRAVRQAARRSGLPTSLTTEDDGVGEKFGSFPRSSHRFRPFRTR